MRRSFGLAVKLFEIELNSRITHWKVIDRVWMSRVTIYYLELFQSMLILCCLHLDVLVLLYGPSLLNRSHWPDKLADRSCKEQ